MSRFAGFVGALLAPIVIAGCGSTGPSKADYLAQGDALCVGARHQLDALTAPSSATEIAGYLDRSLAINRDMLGRLRALTPPHGDEAAVRKILADFDSLLVKGRSVQATAVTGDETATDAAVKELTGSVEKVGAEARGYGFKSCGSAASGSDAGAGGPAPAAPSGSPRGAASPAGGGPGS